MSDAISSQGATLEISGASGGALTITDITLTNPTILTDVAHGLVDGDIVTASNFAGADAASINGNNYVVKNVTDDTFAIELDSSALTITDNTGAALMTPLAWAEVGEIVDWDGPGGSASVIDVTHLSSTAKEKLMGLPDEGQFTFSMNYVFDDVGQVACWSARSTQTERNFRVTFIDASTQTFAGYVLAFGSSGGVDSKVNGSITIEITGAVTKA